MKYMANSLVDAKMSENRGKYDEKNDSCFCFSAFLCMECSTTGVHCQPARMSAKKKRDKQGKLGFISSTGAVTEDGLTFPVRRKITLLLRVFFSFSHERPVYNTRVRCIYRNVSALSKARLRTCTSRPLARPPARSPASKLMEHI